MKKEKSEISSFFEYIHESVNTLNTSKIFAGVMIIILNVSSKFVNLKISKTIESYLKNTFSRQILVFAIAWMGTRDIYVSILFSFLFIFFVDYFFNETSVFCCLPEQFTNYHLNLLKEDDYNNCEHFTKEDVEKAISVLEKAQAILEKSKKTTSLENKTIENKPNEEMKKTYLNQHYVI